MTERDRCTTAVNMLRQVMQKSFTTQPEMFVSSKGKWIIGESGLSSLKSTQTKPLHSNSPRKSFP